MLLGLGFGCYVTVDSCLVFYVVGFDGVLVAQELALVNEAHNFIAG